MAKQVIADHSGAKRIIQSWLANQKRQYSMPVLDDQGRATGETYDTRLERPGQPDPNRFRAHLDYLSKKYGGYEPRPGETVPEFNPVDPYESSGLGESLSNILASAYTQSITGEIEKGLGKIGIGDDEVDAFGLIDKNKLDAWRPNTAEQIGSGIGSFLMPADLAVMAAGGAVGGAIAKGAQLGRVGARITRSALQLGSYEGARGFFEGIYDPNKSTLEEMAVGFGKGAFLGATLGGVGEVAGKLIPKTIRGASVINKANEVGAEIFTLGTVSPLLEGEAPGADDYVNAAGFIVGIKTLGAFGGLSKKVFERKKSAELNRMKEAMDEGRPAEEVIPELVEKAIEENPGLNHKFVRRAKAAEDGAEVGKLGDFIVGDKTRKLFAEDALETPVKVSSKAPEKAGEVGAENVAGWVGWDTDGVYKIFIHPQHRASAGFTILHEAAHLMRRAKGRELGSAKAEGTANEMAKYVAETKDLTPEQRGKLVQRQWEKPFQNKATATIRAERVEGPAARKAISEIIPDQKAKPKAFVFITEPAKKSAQYAKKLFGRNRQGVTVGVYETTPGKESWTVLDVSAPSTEARVALVKRAAEEARLDGVNLYVSDKLTKTQAFAELQKAGLVSEKPVGRYYQVKTEAKGKEANEIVQPNQTTGNDLGGKREVGNETDFVTKNTPLVEGTVPGSTGFTIPREPKIPVGKPEVPVEPDRAVVDVTEQRLRDKRAELRDLYRQSGRQVSEEYIQSLSVEQMDYILTGGREGKAPTADAPSEAVKPRASETPTRGVKKAKESAPPAVEAAKKPTRTDGKRIFKASHEKGDFEITVETVEDALAEGALYPDEIPGLKGAGHTHAGVEFDPSQGKRVATMTGKSEAELVAKIKGMQSLNFKEVAPTADAFRKVGDKDGKEPWEMTAREYSAGVHDRFLDVMERFRGGGVFTARDVITDPILLKHFKDVLDIPITISRDLGKFNGDVGAKVNWGGAAKRLLLGDKTASIYKPNIRLKPDAGPITLYHELTHAQRYLKNRSMSHSEIYSSRPHEQSARKAASFTSPRNVHKRYVEQALRDGKPVPPEVLADYPDLAPKSPTADAFRTVTDKTVAEATSFSEEAGKKVREFSDRIIPGFAKQLKNRFKTEEGQELVRDNGQLSIDTVYKIMHRGVGTTLEKMRQGGFVIRSKVEQFVTGKGSLTEEQRKDIAAVIDPLPGERSKAVDPEVRQVAQHIAAILRERHAYYQKIWQAAGLKLGYVQNYFPRVVQREIREAMYADMRKAKELLAEATDKSDRAVRAVLAGKNNLAEAVEHILKSKQSKDLFSALKQLDRHLTYEMGAGDMFSSARFEKPRRLDLPSKFYERDAGKVLPEYLMAMEKRAAELQVWGNHGEKALNLLEKIRDKDPEEYRTAMKMMRIFTGVEQAEHGYTGKSKKFIDAFVAAEFATKIGLGRATLLNLSQPIISFGQEMGIWNTVRAGFDLFDPKVRSFLRESGAIDRYLLEAVTGGERPGGFAGKIAEKMGTVSGFSGVNKALQYWAGSTFWRAARSWHGTAQGNSAHARWAQQRLADFGIDYKKPLAIQQNTMLESIYRFATDSQLQANILRDPLMMNDPRLRPLFVFKRFGVRQMSYLKDTMKRELGRGNVMPLIRLGAAGMAGGEVTIWTINKIKAMLSGEPAYREEDEWQDRALNNLAFIGSLGMMSDMLEIDRVSKIPKSVRFALEPVGLADAYTAIDTSTRFLADWEKYGDGWLATRRNAHSIFGFFGSYPRQLGARLRTDAQQSDRLDQRKGEERRRIFEAILEGDAEAASRRVQNWNNGNPDNPLTLNDVGPNAMKKWIRQQAKLYARAKGGDKAAMRAAEAERRDELLSELNKRESVLERYRERI